VARCVTTSRVRYHFASRATPLKRGSVGRTESRALKRQHVLAAALFVAVLMAVAPAIWERLERGLQSIQHAAATRLFAPYQRFYDETDVFRREARSSAPNASLAPRARKLLADSERFSQDWNYGNAIHYSNVFLGRVALQNGDIQEARKRLLAAGRTPGSPQLDDYGPDMTLADELLERGESAPVLEYFQECQHFWVNASRNRLGEWSRTIRSGKRPDFGKRSGHSTAQSPPNSARSSGLRPGLC
jgi:hypothetical protein